MHGQQGPRRELSPRWLARTLEHRLYLGEPSPASVAAGCEEAVGRGLAAVICRPEHVEVAAAAVAGSAVAVVTALAWHRDEYGPLATDDLLTEADDLARAGATDLAVAVTGRRLLVDDGRQAAEQVERVADVAGGAGARVRVILDTDGLDCAGVRSACARLGRTGAWLLQGGSWRGSRTRLAHVHLMRAALPPGVRLKWTHPVDSVDKLLICLAEGVDRFNADIDLVLAEARARADSGGLFVPVAGADY